MRILIADKFEEQGVEALGALGCEVVVEPELGPETLPAALDRVKPEILVVRSTKVPASVIESCDTLRGIIRAGSGYDNIDGPAARARGVDVCNCPGMNAVAVAELTIGHLLNLDRRLPAQDAELKSGHWNKKEYSKARGLKGLRMLVIGLGSIGREVALRARAFGIETIAAVRHTTPERAGELGVTLIESDRDSLLKALPTVDIVSVHVPANDQTKGMCDSEFFSAMKPGSYFINTSRGALVDEPALIEAVKNRGIRAGLDVYQNQPAFKEGDWDCEVAKVDGVVCSHHVGASTDQAQQAVADEVVRLVRVFQDTGRFENVVNAGQSATADV
ncbi:MAG TPA: phosphoglycerate dehydrogenase [Phycisphaerales bacterium]|nr:phosphoglycerate dehydrogenase [Phycisphaerales bacterium]